MSKENLSVAVRAAFCEKAKKTAAKLPTILKNERKNGILNVIDDKRKNRMENKIKVFENKQVRTVWNAEEEEWYFSVVDVVSVLTDSANPRKYWSVLKTRLKAEGSEVTTNCSQLKMLAPDGKMRMRDAMKTRDILRLVQSIPSPKAEPFKMWLAQAGSERLDEIADPEKAILRGADFYRAKGYTEGWINQRLQTIEMRKKLTDEWKERGVKEGVEYAILTDEMTKAWSGMSVKEYKELKGLKKENLRDNMTDIELVLNMLAEVTTTTLSKKERPETFDENRTVARRGGKFAGETRERFEKEIGGKVISPLNASDKPALEVRRDEDED